MKKKGTDMKRMKHLPLIFLIFMTATACITLSNAGSKIETITAEKAGSCQFLGKVEGQAADRYDARVIALNEAALLKASHVFWENSGTKTLGIVYKFEAKAYLCK